jgi:hypothetical protein
VTLRMIARLLNVDAGCVRRERLPMTIPLWRGEHSWAGTQGREAYLVWETDECTGEPLDAGGWFSANGTITWSTSPVSLAIALKRAGAHAGQLVAVREWSTYSGEERPTEVCVFRLTAKDEEQIARFADPLDAEV